MGQYKHHVFVCTFGKQCRRDGSDDVYSALKKEVKHCGLKPLIRVNHAGCMNQCGHGPMVVVYPDDVWYGAVTVKAARRIVEEHLCHGRVVDDLRYVAPPGDNKDS